MVWDAKTEPGDAVLRLWRRSGCETSRLYVRGQSQHRQAHSSLAASPLAQSQYTLGITRHKRFFKKKLATHQNQSSSPGAPV